MRLPEYFLSTPRLIAVLLAGALIYLAITGTVQAEDFIAIVTLVFGYFFGSRGKEEKRETDNSPLSSTLN